MTIRMSGIAVAVLALLAAGCNDDDEVQIGGGDFAVNTRPAFVSGTVTSTTYDGNTDDLLTAGLGKTGLASATPPSTSATPTAAELRRLAIYNNYRALVDMTTAGGYGVFY
ncbi:MAG TPA: 3-hydroxybutyrate oligomer hydrolase family protein, partial [Burkholderiaceae bacterium]|nr:3-hydroxybutyrate oligomer hydrolase family protein [Burkholderiaceae bacterium]